MQAQENTRTVYILLTRSGTWLSRLIYLTTAADYTHVAISLDGHLGPYYSFGRKHPEHTLPAGFVREPVQWHMKNRGGMPCRLYALPVSADCYDRLRQRLGTMYAQRDRYGYNLLGAMACWFNLPLRRRYHYFCSQFVAGLLEECGAMEFSKSTDLLHPADFCACRELHTLHWGEIGALPVFPLPSGQAM